MREVNGKENGERWEKRRDNNRSNGVEENNTWLSYITLSIIHTIHTHDGVYIPYTTQYTHRYDSIYTLCTLIYTLHWQHIWLP